MSFYYTGMDKIWKTIDGYDGIYEVSSDGDVRSRGRIHRGSMNKGYHFVYLSHAGIGKLNAAHRLVAICFIPNPMGKPEVNHKNGIRNDNRVENLEWVTHAENMRHAAKRLGTCTTPAACTTKGMTGKRCPTSRLIEQVDKAGRVIGRFWGVYECERATGVSAKSISKVLYQKGRKTAFGYGWRFATSRITPVDYGEDS
jgi:hypothetical protein